MIRTVVVDDSELVRAGLRMIVDSGTDTTVVAEASAGGDAVAVVRDMPGEVDVVLMDIDMPGMNGIDATRKIVEMENAPKVLIVTTFAVETYVYDAIMAGASGFLLKDTPPESLLAAIVSTHAGTAVVSPQMTRRLLASQTPRATPSASAARSAKLDSLTERERDVLTLIGRGMNNAEIAAELVIAEVTVKTHVGHILRKLEVRDRIRCVVFAYEAGVMAGEE
ncbi:response regulator transcription factor [Rhodococcus sp. MEB041]|uniref:response regulator n=1 Tax=Rhodococcus sp. MEB041 TaxID=3040323 RepID=UPI00254AF3B4|nr:response regulator transcription factor [Rhodococcus sp. MEB041]